MTDYIYIPEYVVPAFSAFCCILLLLLSCRDIYSHRELRIKRLTLLYLSVSLFSWASTFTYFFFPGIFVYLQSFTYPCMLYTQVLFYRIVYELTAEGGGKRFTPLHYTVPALIFAVLAVWSLFVPYNVQLDIVTGRGRVIPEGYRVYALFFMSKQGVRLLYGVVYMTFVFAQLTKYYKDLNRSVNLVRKPTRWILLLVGLAVASVVVTVVWGIMCGNGLSLHWMAFIPSATIVAQFVVLTYHIISRQYLLYDTTVTVKPVAPKEQAGTGIGTDILHAAEETEEQEETAITAPAKRRKTYTRVEKPLTRRSLEAYLNKHKPYLDPDFKITDLADAMKNNRTYLSGFVNKTYGLNFNRFVNRRRLAELDRLMQLPSNVGKTVREMVQKAGFSDYKHYTRSQRIERQHDSITMAPAAERSEE